MINKKLISKLTKKRKHKVYKEFGLMNFRNLFSFGGSNRLFPYFLCVKF